MRAPDTSAEFRASGRSLVTDPVVEVAPQESGRPLGTVLLERNYAGLTVEVSWNAQDDTVHLFVQKGEELGVTTKIEKGEAREAFDHPYCYLPD